MSPADRLGIWLSGRRVPKEIGAFAGKSIGDFFEYDLKQNISIGQNQSALVPIVQSRLEAEKVTLWNADSVPLLALWIKNTSGQMLDSGSFNIIEGNTFAGEGVLEVLHPDERRLLSYAGDSALHVKTLTDSSSSPFTRVRIFKGNITMTSEERKKTKSQKCILAPVRQGLIFCFL